MSVTRSSYTSIGEVELTRSGDTSGSEPDRSRNVSALQEHVVKVTLIDSHDDGQPLQPGSLLQQVVRSRNFLYAVGDAIILVV
jgi:hypothetical protein